MGLVCYAAGQRSRGPVTGKRGPKLRAPRLRGSLRPRPLPSGILRPRPCPCAPGWLASALLSPTRSRVASNADILCCSVSESGGGNAPTFGTHFPEVISLLGDNGKRWPGVQPGLLLTTWGPSQLRGCKTPGPGLKPASGGRHWLRLAVSPRSCPQQHHTCGLKLATAGVFAPRDSANASVRAPSREPAVEHLPAQCLLSSDSASRTVPGCAPFRLLVKRNI